MGRSCCSLLLPLPLLPLPEPRPSPEHSPSSTCPSPAGALAPCLSHSVLQHERQLVQLVEYDGRRWPHVASGGYPGKDLLYYVYMHIYICIDMHMHLSLHIYRYVTIGNMLCLRVDKCVIQWWTHLSGTRLSLPVVPVT